MEELLTKEGLAYIVSRILDNAKDTFKESKTDKSEFVDGKKLAYYEMLDTINNALCHRKSIQQIGEHNGKQQHPSKRK